MLCEHRYELYYTLNLGGLRNLIFAQSLKKGFIFYFYIDGNSLVIGMNGWGQISSIQ